jgi:hypothetical protein
LDPAANLLNPAYDHTSATAAIFIIISGLIGFYLVFYRCIREISHWKTDFIRKIICYISRTRISCIEPLLLGKRLKPVRQTSKQYGQDRRLDLRPCSGCRLAHTSPILIPLSFSSWRTEGSFKGVCECAEQVLWIHPIYP